MSQDPNKKVNKSFQCREALWTKFEQMSKELECSVDYLINDAMKQYARQRGYGAATAGPSPSMLPQPPSAAGVPTPMAPPPPPSMQLAPPPPRSRRRRRACRGSRRRPHRPEARSRAAATSPTHVPSTRAKGPDATSAGEPRGTAAEAAERASSRAQPHHSLPG